jgi:3,4-dihydroxy 2-butanone 4-phosphate synthase/GTP cyclohydrolase II
MAKHGRGLICLTLTETDCARLGLRPMVAHNGSSHGTNFTVSIEAAEGVSTGISAADRALTIQCAVAADARPEHLVQPGHVFPLAAVEGGVLMRAGHTEAGCDLAALAGLRPAAVICEIMNDDGSMARLPDLEKFACEHGLKIGTIADLIHYRAAHDSLIERIGESTLDTPIGPLPAFAFRDRPTGAVHLALVNGPLDTHRETLVRVHEPVSILDWLHAGSGGHSYPLAAALQAIAAASQGVLVLLNCNESGEQLIDRFQGLNGHAHGARKPVSERRKDDLRNYGIGAQILKNLGVGKMRLLARPRKMPSMTGFGLEVVGYAGEEIV